MLALLGCGILQPCVPLALEPHRKQVAQDRTDLFRDSRHHVRTPPAERIHVPAIMLPYTVGGSERARDLFGLFDDTVDRLNRGLSGGASVKH